eukprot:TRINITY_DN19443_c0_g1_i1.p1 TRINITY_DN19443_c0_g1~~TRINITY_DN19443_c0_g1_i1.p1  ORF type:complete len:197 (+),score=14.56 TRINITY_DN19443_c0_g1_i1:30-593(+)
MCIRDRIDRVFLYGKSILVTTPIQKHQGSYSVYFPNANWYKFPSGEIYSSYNRNRSQGVILQVTVSSDRANIFLRGGSIIPYQDAINLKIRNAEELKETPMSLIIALDENSQASGRMIADDGVSKDTIERKKYRHYSYVFSNKTLKVMMLEGYNYTTPPDGSYPFESFTRLQIIGATNFKNITSACI